MFGPFGSADPAVKQFEQKFKDKTRNNWAQRDNFVPSPGKYTLIEVGEFEDASGPSATAAVASTGPKFNAVCFAYCTSTIFIIINRLPLIRSLFELFTSNTTGCTLLCSRRRCCRANWTRRRASSWTSSSTRTPSRFDQ